MRFILILLTAQMGTMCTHYLAQKKTFGPVRASSLVTLLFIIMTAPFEFAMKEVLHSVCLGASFVGMSDPQRLSYCQLGLASLTFALFFNYFIHHFSGLGGALGFSAFVGCLFIWILFALYRKMKSEQNHRGT